MLGLVNNFKLLTKLVNLIIYIDFKFILHVCCSIIISHSSFL